jgi:hypothetical protein
MPVFYKLIIQIFKDVTHPRQLDAEGRGGAFPLNVSNYRPPQRIIPQRMNLHLLFCQNLKTLTLLKLLQSTL